MLARAVLVIAMALSPTVAEALLALERKIPLGEVRGRIDHMAIDTKRQRLFIAELGCTRAAAMQLMFGLYAALGLVALAVYRPLSPQVEIADEAPKAPLEQSKRLVY